MLIFFKVVKKIPLQKKINHKNTIFFRFLNEVLHFICIQEYILRQKAILQLYLTKIIA